MERTCLEEHGQRALLDCRRGSATRLEGRDERFVVHVRTTT